MSYPEYPDPHYPQPQYPQPQYPQLQPPNRGPQIIAVIAAIVALAAVVAVIVLFVNSGGDDEAAAPESSGPVVTEYVQAPASPGSDTDTGVKQPPAPPRQSSPAPQQPNPPVNGANAHGFVNGPQCQDSADPLVFIGYTQRSEVIVCQVGRQTGRYYYKGKADGNSSHVDFPTRSGNTFTATNGSTSYIVSPQSLVITENGRVLATEPMLEAWVG